MEKSVRKLLQLVALGIFLYQMINSWINYLNKHQIQETSLKTFPAPILHICQQKAFSYEKAAKIGYASKANFLAGKLEGSGNLTWRGKHGNMTFEDEFELIFYQGLETVNVYNSSHWIFNILLGHCLELESVPTDNVFEITTKESIIIDLKPSTSKILRNSNPESSIHIGPSGGDTYMYAVYNLVYSEQDNVIMAGESCTNNQESSYTACRGDAIGSYLFSVYGCLPPWWPNKNNITCEKHSPMRQLPGDVQDKLLADLDDLTDGLEIDAMNQCLPPCVTTHVEATTLGSFTNFPNHAKLKLMIL